MNECTAALNVNERKKMCFTVHKNQRMVDFARTLRNSSTRKGDHSSAHQVRDDRQTRKTILAPLLVVAAFASLCFSGCSVISEKIPWLLL